MRFTGDTSILLELAELLKETNIDTLIEALCIDFDDDPCAAAFAAALMGAVERDRDELLDVINEGLTKLKVVS